MISADETSRIQIQAQIRNDGARSIKLSYRPNKTFDLCFSPKFHQRRLQCGASRKSRAVTQTRTVSIPCRGLHHEVAFSTGARLPTNTPDICRFPPRASVPAWISTQHTACLLARLLMH